MFEFRNGSLHAESVPLETIAREFGTPCYVYSRAALAAALAQFQSAAAGHDVLLCYAMKANSNLAILNLFAGMGAGFDIVSGGELARVIAAGGDPRKVIFSGVGKSAADMRYALESGILCFNVESAAELARLAAVAAETGKRAPVSVRVNPDVDARTHPYISTGLKENKFGVEFDAAMELYRAAARAPQIEIVGIDCHIGSNLIEHAPLIEALEKMLALVDRLAAEGIRLRHLDLGGGLGIRYRDESPPDAAAYLREVFAHVGERKLKLLFEPGRTLVGNAGLLLTRIEYLKPGAARNFAVVDAAMNDLIRPALYQAWHDIVAVRKGGGPSAVYDVVGPVCESADFLGKERDLAVSEGDLLAVMSAGAYAMCMSSNYNSRPRAAEVMVDGAKAHLIRERERPEALFALERVLG
ncbi:MAG: diaminopimelate decarboxylase [Burkholderiales bacterium]